MKRSSAAVGTVFFLFLAPGTVAGLGPWLLSRWRIGAPFFGLAVLRPIGAILILAGVAILMDSFARFALQGLGTPAPVLPTRRLLVTGLYRHVRNPMYVAVVSIVAGQGFLLGNATILAYSVLVWLGFHIFIVGYEEPTLRKSFEAEYEAFCASVPRWLPRMQPWRGT